jgi:hypothetical protein
MLFKLLKLSNLSSTHTAKLIAVFCINLKLKLIRAKISLMFSIMKEKSIDEREISNWFLLTMKQGK